MQFQNRLHKATHFDSSATARKQEETLARPVTVWYRQNPRYKKYRNSPQPA